ncbi:MAG: hypothetical protein HYS04_09535 [Acidobacteria bacterium]|nr:hypothetical protein [Acidobacteriota bacterium]
MRSALLFLVAAAVSLVFLIDFCGWLYGCGCHSLWAGADAHCNIHQPGPPDCPWCAIGVAGSLVFVAAPILAAQAGVVLASAGWPFLPRLALAILAFPATGLLIGTAIGLWRGYWR